MLSVYTDELHLFLPPYSIVFQCTKTAMATASTLLYRQQSQKSGQGYRVRILHSCYPIIFLSPHISLLDCLIYI